ncbi:MAG: DUF2339 domain-containing protein, partial [Bacteroidia bacterium]|nr:DUF2339 domain-containing protein [Bacteroidia bacterium]
QMDGNYVTLIWLCEMVVLMWMTKKTNINTYKYLAYGLSLLAFFSLWHDWSNYSYFSNNTDTTLAFQPLMNRYFLTSIIGTGVFGFVWFMNKQMLSSTISKIANVVLIVFGLIVCYMTFANEIMQYFNIQYRLSETKRIGDYGYDWTDYDSAWNSYSGLWMIIYSMVFFSVLGWLSIKKFTNAVFAYICWSMNFLMLLIGVTAGFAIISDLKMEAVNDYSYSVITTWNYNSRYLFVPFVAMMIFMIYQYRNAEILKKIRPINFWLFHMTILAVLSNELSHITTMLHLDNYNHYSKVAFRMGYTVLWGVYSMALITYGIIRERKTLRFIAISLFVLTLLKLASDAMSMTMGYRLIVFIVIGIILLVVSFMYQKFKPLLFGKDGEEKAIEPNTTTDETN